MKFNKNIQIPKNLSNFVVLQLIQYFIFDTKFENPGLNLIDILHNYFSTLRGNDYAYEIYFEFLKKYFILNVFFYDLQMIINYKILMIIIAKYLIYTM